MQEEELKMKTKQPNTLCCYQLDNNDEQEQTRPRNTDGRLPMTERGIVSTITFRNIELNNKEPIYQLLHDLYEGSSSADIYSLLASKRINPIIHGSQERDDLEYYIPQLVTFLVLEKNLEDEQLISFILKGCSTDFYFAHRVYFYLRSLSQFENGQQITSVLQFLEGKFMAHMQMYKTCKLSGIEFTKSMLQMDHELTNKHLFPEDQPRPHSQPTREAEEDQLVWEGYGTRSYPNPTPLNPKPIRKVKRKAYCEHGFMETPKFWDDLLEIGSKVCKAPADERNRQLSKQIMKINCNLPANVYIPFFKEEMRLYTMLTVWKGRLFATNTRAPYSIWVEMYREEEELNLEKVVQEEEDEEEAGQLPKKPKKNILEKIYDSISKPFSISNEKNTLNIKQFLADKLSFKEGYNEIKKQSMSKSKRKSIVSLSFAEESLTRRYSISQIYEEREKETKSEGRESIGSRSFNSSISSAHDDQDGNSEEGMREFFGAKATDIMQEFREHSIYRQLKSWRLVHLMVKTGDDIKQEQFAMQLINRFQYAFTKGKVECMVFPYEVISLGPDSGLIEMLNDITTLNSLFQKLHSKGMTLRQFFNKVYPNPALARRNFMRSLAGYSILSYFLQVKDRHNGNILLSRDGHIIHIDFGFFLSNTPGKGVELEKKVPFKLLTEYVEVIGEPNSIQFFEFRQLFYKGFRAVLAEKEAILTLVRMMYSSHLESMACFIKGEAAIEQLQRRFQIEQGVESFCYNLINSSLDNWRARWYDKFQYFLQKIYY